MKPVLHSSTNNTGAAAIATLLGRMKVSAWVRGLDYRRTGGGR
jgi:hypothetical protein